MVSSKKIYIINGYFVQNNYIVEKIKNLTWKFLGF